MSLLLWLIYLAGCWGLADIFIKQAKFDLRYGQTEKLAVDTWPATHIALQWALYFEPQHPDFLEFTGMEHFLRANSSARIAKKFTAYQDALDYFSRAARQRPVSAYTWANMALMKHLLRRYDAHWETALETAAQLGPWEPFVQLAVIDVGLAKWESLPQKTQSVVLTMIERGMQWQAKQVRTLIEGHKRKEVVCAFNGQKAIFANFCH